jgi:hypothetical protein
MKKALCIIILVLSIAFNAVHDAGADVYGAPDSPITIGNNTYLPLNLQDFPPRNVKEILAALKNFEKTNPDLEILFWTIEQLQKPSYCRTCGIWVYHRPRQK